MCSLQKQIPANPRRCTFATKNGCRKNGCRKKKMRSYKLFLSRNEARLGAEFRDKNNLKDQESALQARCHRTLILYVCDTL